ncbi:hypothetical protein ACOMHN_060384 [Nucella lapillus]
MMSQKVTRYITAMMSQTSSGLCVENKQWPVCAEQAVACVWRTSSGLCVENKQWPVCGEQSWGCPCCVVVSKPLIRRVSQRCVLAGSLPVHPAHPAPAAEASPPDMSEESSGSLPHPHREVCVVICNGNDREPSTTTADPTHPHPHQDPAEKECPAPTTTNHNEEGRPLQEASREEVEEKDEREDSQEQAMLPKEEEEGEEVGGGGEGKRVRKGSKAGDRQGHPPLSATFGVTPVEDDDELPFPGFVPKAFYYFHQTHPLRFACLRLITNPYPFG